MFNRLYIMTHECKPSRREPISPVSNINHSRTFGPAHGQGHSPAAVRWHTPRRAFYRFTCACLVLARTSLPSRRSLCKL